MSSFTFFKYSIFSEVIPSFPFLLFSFFQGCDSIYQENQYTKFKLETKEYIILAGAPRRVDKGLNLTLDHICTLKTGP